MSRKRCIFFIILLAAGTAGAQEPPWLLLERGKSAFDRRDLTASVDLFLQAADALDGYPEAEYWLGRVYAAQGQSVLAEQQYRRALSFSIYLRVPARKFEIYYALADLLLNLGEARRSEAIVILSEIADSDGASTPAEIRLEHRYVDVMTTRGLDELIYLYRDELGRSLRARRRLGELAWEDGRYRSALLHSSRTVLAMMSTAAEEYRASNPTWRFDIDVPADEQNPDRDVRLPGPDDGAAELIGELNDGGPKILEWLTDTGFWSQLYLLSASLYAEGYPEQARSLWSLLAPGDAAAGIPVPLPVAGQWGILASKQLEEPFIISGSLAP